MIKYTRHAKRRMKLYKITENEIQTIINSGNKKTSFENKIEFMNKLPQKELPVKVVCKMKENDYIVITCYPLKKGIIK